MGSWSGDVMRGAMVLTAALVIATPAASQAPPRSLDWAGWLAGCWERRRDGHTTVEMWMPPAGGVMLGASRSVSDGVARGHEFMMLRSSDAGVEYVAAPSGQGTTTFTAVAHSDSSFTVENLAHDFPQRIIYRRIGADSLVARIEGPGPAGRRSIEFPMRRTSCRP